MNREALLKHVTQPNEQSTGLNGQAPQYHSMAQPMPIPGDLIVVERNTEYRREVTVWKLAWLPDAGAYLPEAEEARR